MQIPQIPDLHDKSVAKAHAKHIKHVRELAEKQQAAEKAKAVHEAAAGADVEAAAQANLAERPRPKPTADKAKQALEDAIGEVEVAKSTAEKAGQAVAAIIEKTRPALEQQAADRVTAARVKFIRLLDELEATHAELAVEEATVGWLRRWPNDRGGVGQRYVTDLPPAPNGDPLTTDAVLGALRKRGLPPEPKRPAGSLMMSERGALVPSEPLLETLT